MPTQQHYYRHYYWIKHFATHLVSRIFISVGNTEPGNNYAITSSCSDKEQKTPPKCWIYLCPNESICCVPVALIIRYVIPLIFK